MFFNGSIDYSFIWNITSILSNISNYNRHRSLNKAFLYFKFTNQIFEDNFKFIKFDYLYYFILYFLLYLYIIIIIRMCKNL